MPPKVSFLTVPSAAMTSACDEPGVRLALLPTVAKTVPAAQPMNATAPYCWLLLRPGEYFSMAACMAWVAGMELSNHGPSWVLPIAPSPAGCDSHGVVISPAVVTQVGL